MKKKGLIFIEDGSFTFDNRVIREANALIDDGWEITVISPKFSGDPFYKCMSKNLRAYYYPKITFKSILGHIIEALFTLLFGTIFSLWVFLRHGFTVFHACNPMDILWLIALPYKAIGKKFIFDQHDLVPELIRSRLKTSESSLFYKLFILFEKCSYKAACVVIATNESYKKIAEIRGGKNAQDVFIVRNGPDLEKFKVGPPKKGIKNEGDILIGYLGNMNPQDGAEYLLDAAEIIIKRKKKSHFRFVFIGGGHSQPELIEKSKKLGLSENVSFPGRIPDDEMLATLNACDICVQPDPSNPLNDKSTMNKVMEYMALEKPVIAFDLKETRVSGGDAALYVTPNDLVELADKIIYLADNPKLRIKLGKVGRNRVESKLSWDHSIPNLLSAYQYVLEK